jgi:hypothetical protein
MDHELLIRTSLCSTQPAEPLWQRAPTRDENGKPLSDFMMLIPKLSAKPKHYLQNTLDQLQKVFSQYEHAVVFADLNLKLNVLWVSVRPIPGICLELPAAIKVQVPEALLVGCKTEHFR